MQQHTIKPNNNTKTTIQQNKIQNDTKIQNTNNTQNTKTHKIQKYKKYTNTKYTERNKKAQKHNEHNNNTKNTKIKNTNYKIYNKTTKQKNPIQNTK